MAVAAFGITGWLSEHFSRVESGSFADVPRPNKVWTDVFRVSATNGERRFQKLDQTCCQRGVFRLGCYSYRDREWLRTVVVDAEPASAGGMDILTVASR